MTSAQEAEIKLKKYEGLNNDYPSLMVISATSQLDPAVMAIQGQGIQAGNQNLNASLPRPNWKANLTCYKCGEKGHLTGECLHIGNATTTQPQSPQTIINPQTTPSRLTCY